MPTVLLAFLLLAAAIDPRMAEPLRLLAEVGARESIDDDPGQVYADLPEPLGLTLAVAGASSVTASMRLNPCYPGLLIVAESTRTAMTRSSSGTGRTLGRTRSSSRPAVRARSPRFTVADLDPERSAGHSLRAGLATAAAIVGVEERAIMVQTRRRSVTVARRYIQDGSLFRGNATAAVGL